MANALPHDAVHVQVYRQCAMPMTRLAIGGHGCGPMLVLAELQNFLALESRHRQLCLDDLVKLFGHVPDLDHP